MKKSPSKGRVATVFILVTITLVMAGYVPSSARWDRSGLSGPYRNTLERWTSEEKIYKDLLPVLFVTATYKSQAYRTEFAREYAEDYKLVCGRDEKLLADQRAAASASLDFIVAVFAPDKAGKDLEDRDSLWNVFLEGDCLGRLTPFEIRRVSKRKKAFLMEYFPYISPWAWVYEIRFLSPCGEPASGQLHLTITGVRGTARLVYDLEDRHLQ